MIKQSMAPGAIKQSSLLAPLFPLIRDSLRYMVGTIFVGLGNVALIPLYTRSLNPEQFGIYALIDITLMVVVTICQLGFNVSYLKWFTQIEEEKQSYLLGTAVSVTFLASLVGLGLFFALLTISLGKDWLQTVPRSIVWVFLPILSLETLQIIFLTDLRARRQAAKFSIASVVRLIVIIVSSIWFIWFQNRGLMGIFLGRFVGDTVGILLLISFCLKQLKLTISWDWAKPMIRFGLPVVWSALFAMLLDASGRYFLSRFNLLEDVGYYSAAIKISNVVRILITIPFGMAWGGVMFQIAKQKNAQTIYSKTFNYMLVFSALVSLGIVVFAPAFVYFLTTPEYLPATQVFPCLLLVQVCTILQYPASIGLYLKDKTHFFVPIYAIAIIFNLLCSLILVPRMGMIGAALALLMGWVIIIVLELKVGQRYYPLNINWQIALFTFILFWVISWVSAYSAPGLTSHDLLLQTLYFILAVALVGLWGVLEYRSYIQVNRVLSK